MDLTHRITIALADRYRVAAEIGRGGSAVVFRAHDLKHGREVAIKVLNPELTATLAAERFLREIASTARLTHPNVLPLLDSGSADGLLYFVTPFLADDTLRVRLRREGQLPISDVIRIVSDIADGLSAAHQLGVVHRDIKPENILLSGRHAVIADFGVAKATSQSLIAGLTAGVALGTPTYMSPEQATADPNIDHRADIYALGVLGYELLAGRPPFVGRTPQETLTGHILQTPEAVDQWRPDVPQALANVIMRCLAKSPEQRFATAAEVVAALDPLSSGAEITPVPALPAVLRRRHGPAVALAATSLVAVAVWLGTRSSSAPLSTEVGQQQATFSGNVEEVALSPDGTLLAMIQRDGAERRVVVSARDGGNQVEIGRGPRISGLQWTGDGSRVAYGVIEPGRVRYLSSPVLGGQTTTVAAQRVVLSPDGSTAAILPYTSTALRFAKVGGTDTAVVDLSAAKPEPWALQLAWAPAGNRLAVLTTPSNRVGARFLIAEPGSSTPDPITVDSVTVHGFCWAAAGDTLLLLVQRGPTAALEALPIGRGPGRGHLATIATGLAATTVSSDRATTLTTSRDGRLIAYAPQATYGNVVIAEPRGGAIGSERALTRGTANHDLAKLSPDGSTIGYFRRQPGAGTTVGTVPFAGGPSRDLTHFDDALDLAWSPDGGTIAVVGRVAPDSTSIYLIDREGLIRRRIAVDEPLGGQVAWWDATTLWVQGEQNRRFLAVATSAGRPREVVFDAAPGWAFDAQPGPAGSVAFYWNLGKRQGTWLRPAGGAPRQIDSVAGVVLGWSADGTEVVVARRPGESGGRLFAVRVADGRERLLARTPEGLVIDAIAPDLSAAIGHRVESRGDVWVIERR